jgi:hypothetical protein
MKKPKQLEPPLVGETAVEIGINRIFDVVHATAKRKQTSLEKRATRILSDCLANRFDPRHPSAFSQADKDSATEVHRSWVFGDLANGRAGAEFIYFYLATSFVADLLKEAKRLTTAPITSNGGNEAKLSRKAANGLAETFTTAGTIYLLNNLRAKLNESVEDLFTEARVVVEELYRAVLSSSLSELEGKESDAIEIGQSRFTTIIKSVIEEQNRRHRKRLRGALWEIARRPGRPRGESRSKVSRVYSRTQFLHDLNQKIRELSRASESNVTRTEIAKALKLSNPKALDRLRRQFGDDSRWKERVAEALAV